jgi:hypothetical protein
MLGRAVILLGLFAFLAVAQADQVEMQNGDHYVGKIISMTGDTVLLQSDVLGRVTLPRSKVASVTLGANQIHAVASPSHTNANNADGLAAFRHLGTNTNFIEQVRKQYLAEAGPEANQKFDDLVGGLLNGNIDINNLRAQAKDAADQIRSLKGQGGDAGDMMDSYLGILDNFLKETAPTSPNPAKPPPATNNTSGISIIKGSRN